MVHLEHPGSGLRPVLDKSGFEFDAGFLQLLLVTQAGQFVRTLDCCLCGLVHRPDFVQGNLGLLVQALAEIRLVFVVRIDDDLLVSEEHNLVKVHAFDVGQTREEYVAIA